MTELPAMLPMPRPWRPDPAPWPNQISAALVTVPPLMFHTPLDPVRPTAMRVLLGMTIDPPLMLSWPLAALPLWSLPTINQPPTLTVPASRLTTPLPSDAPIAKSLPVLTPPVVLMLRVP